MIWLEVFMIPEMFLFDGVQEPVEEIEMDCILEDYEYFYGDDLCE